jgi:hypothetical protein
LAITIDWLCLDPLSSHTHGISPHISMPWTQAMVSAKKKGDGGASVQDCLAAILGAML